MPKGVKVKVTVTEKDHGLAGVIEEHQKLLKKPYVDVGVLGGEHKGEGEGAEMSNILLARVHEYGTDTVPERSFIRSTLFEQRPAIIELVKILKHQIYTGKTTVSKALDVIGLQVQALIRGKISDGDPAWPPLSPKTIAKKGSSKPLIDTGQLQKSITYKKVMK